MALSPMMQDYITRKEDYKDCVLMYRVGDFYEMFFDDAEMVSRELSLTLTGKECGLEKRAPMCGVPFHAVDTYINRLIRNGHRVAICDQVEDPKEAKGLVRREVTRVVTPGTNLDTEAIEDGRNNYIMSVICTSDCYGLAVCDVSTGEFRVTDTASLRRLEDEISKFAPSELICNEALMMSGLDLDLFRNRFNMLIEPLDNRYFAEEAALQVMLDHFHVSSAEGLGISEYPCSVCAGGGLLTYLFETQKTDLSHISHVTAYQSDGYMVLGVSTVRNLELTETLREKEKRGSLLWVLDKTKTAMGARMLRSWIEQPLIQKDEIEMRLDAVEALCRAPICCEELREYLGPVYDLERLVSRISYKSANPRDLIALKTSLQMLPHILGVMKQLEAPYFAEVSDRFDTLEDVAELIEQSIQDDPPLAMKEGGIIRDGYNADVDTYRKAKTDGKQWLAEYEMEERERTGIHTLRVKFNRVFGYCIEVTNSFKDKVPETYIRKQTLTNAERYTTPRLKELEDAILGAEDRLNSLEYLLYSDVRDRISETFTRIQQTAQIVAAADVLASFAKTAQQNRYVRPKINTSGKLNIVGGRHPVVEKMIKNDGFVPNDTLLDNKTNRISIITGPNMAGKSTYMRQTALIVLMAQIGSFVPADSAEIGLVDRIFTRVGASDDLASGQSTFMVEMTEVANILRNATSHSLLILDEIGRGTSTFDGLALAWAIVEYVSDKKIIGAKTLFATHYHELTELEGKIDGVHNFCIAVKEKGEDIVFLRKIVRGGADKSYGIQVARLAGVPEAVLGRAGQLVAQLSQADITEGIEAVTSHSKPKTKAAHYDDVDLEQMSLFDAVSDQDVLKDLENMDVTNMTPLDALNELYRLQNKLKNRWKKD